MPPVSAALEPPPVASETAPSPRTDADDAAPELRPAEALDPCDAVDSNGPLGELLQFLRSQTEPKNIRCVGDARTAQATEIIARVPSPRPHALLEQARLIAMAGLHVEFTPSASGEFSLRATTSNTDRRGVTLIGIETAEVIDASLREVFGPKVLKGALGPLRGEVEFSELVARLEGISARFRVFAKDANALRIEVEAARLIRRVRVRGNLPLPERDIRRALSIDSRPGSFTHGTCIEPKEARKLKPSTTCAEDDLSCQRWEQREIDRVRRYLFDNGYLRASAQILVICGRE
ncbi:MAG: hypothetical protein ACPHRO_15885, partial [Nannocystaceae bacterium]